MDRNLTLCCIRTRIEKTLTEFAKPFFYFNGLGIRHRTNNRSQEELVPDVLTRAAVRFELCFAKELISRRVVGEGWVIEPVASDHMDDHGKQIL